MPRIYFIYLLFLCFCFTSCEQDRFDIHSSDIKTSFKSQRFDHDLINGDFNNLPGLDQSLYQKYGEFYPAYMERILKIGPIDSLSTIEESQKFVQDSIISGIQNDVDSVFNKDKIQEIDQQFEEAFQRIKYYFPEIKIPEIIYFNSGFNNGVVILEGQIGIGLDFYIGSENQYVRKLPSERFQSFKREKMNPEYLIADAFRYWLEVEFEKNINGNELINTVMFKGKILFLMDACFPEMKDHIKIRYFEEEIKWAEEEEYNIWLELGKQEILYGRMNFEAQKWINDAPFTNVGSIPTDSPPRLGEWMGWKMVRDYMKEHLEIKTEAIFEQNPDQIFLTSFDPRN